MNTDHEIFALLFAWSVMLGVLIIMGELNDRPAPPDTCSEPIGTKTGFAGGLYGRISSVSPNSRHVR